ncbi:hypothetical protein GCM10029992_14650 [Glycomyces albus]
MRLEVEPDLVEVALDQVLEGVDAGVVDQQRDVVGEIGSAPHLLGVGDVETDRFDSGEVDGLGPPRRRVDLLGSPFEQVLGEGASDSAIGSGHDCCCSVDLHNGYAKT